MQTIFDLLPDDHFGETMEKTLDLLLSGQSVCVYAIPGGGQIYFSVMAQKLLKKRTPQDTLIHINFPLLSGKYTNYIKHAICTTIGCSETTNWQAKLADFLANHHLVFVFDQIETVVYRQPETFTYLRHLRDFYPKTISFLFISNYQIVTDQKKWFEVGGILFNRLIQVPPFDLNGTARILDTNRYRLDKPYSKSIVQIINKLSGGNPALIKYLGIAYQELNDLTNLNRLITHPGLMVKLNDIASVVFSENSDNLVKLGILNANGQLFSPLLAEYIKKYHLDNIDEIVPNLTVQEKRILTYLLKNKGKLLDKDRLAMLMKLTDDTYSLWAMYQAISRLKRKVKGKYHIKTLKGQGYILEEYNISTKV